MARIIQYGFKRIKELRGTCKNCACKFVPEPAEVKTQEMGGEFFQYAHCPCCNEKVTGFTEEWVTVSYDKPKPPPIRWWHDHPEPPKPQL